ncbi:undecaprenyl/decaprenyl-phosphate alpha-N-acetylglucosaminyl 1-phosphate transferase [Corynebacterium uropygiale]|uniref:Undecaprenyl/decaprenyl-phosphate alpha-N-acetylglucosaminyl 1-phosphate transferase n=1 Tax=Corynebacterium uropygiale TaxID=1775911 RepID=A0A9X1QRQ3_9CORY|nr:MraY family glycosyltransferase [Corynebacterium uropygiale]MCF4006955.1 undecaprenyl/decaprenyl-phosphate alpha-N-acetylglucosaminyl 1-phosphate transferase [Corynebacterium uropygiale]
MGAVGVPLRELGLVILAAAIFTYLTTGLVRSAMVRSGRIGEIRQRDVHTQPTPRMGGVGMFTGFIVAVFLAHQLPALTRGFEPVTPEMTAVLWAAFAIVLVGVLDDLYDLDAITKLIGQIIGAIILSTLGLSWTMVYLPLNEGMTLALDNFQSTIVTALFTVALINAINFVDGLDGLAAGLGLIAGLAILIFSVTVLHDLGGAVSAYPPAMIAAALVGMCGGFLPHNFEPSRIFMGDSGSMLIGLLLAAAATSASGKITMNLYGAADLVALLSPFVVVIAAIFVPMLDLVLAVVRRLAQGRSPFAADKMHLHHRLLKMGHSHRKVVLVLYLWVSVVALSAVSFSVVPVRFAVMISVVALAVALVVTFVPTLSQRSAHRPRGSHAR